MDVKSIRRSTLTVEEAAGLLGVSRGSLYEAIQRKEIPAIKIGRRLVLPADLLDRLAAAVTNK